MQRTTNFHHAIANTSFSDAARLVDDAAAFDAAVDVLETHPTVGDPPTRRFLRARELPASRLPGRHDDLDLGERAGQAAQILEQPAPRGQGVRGRLGNALIMGATRIGVPQQEDHERGIDQQHVFHGVTFFLAALTARLLSRIPGALDAPLRAIVAKRGDAGACVEAATSGSTGGGGPSVGTTRAAASASAISRRLTNSVTDRLGASPKARRVACRTANQTCID
jgi:hypothetical protein